MPNADRDWNIDGGLGASLLPLGPRRLETLGVGQLQTEDPEDPAASNPSRIIEVVVAPGEKLGVFYYANTADEPQVNRLVSGPGKDSGVQVGMIIVAVGGQSIVGLPYLAANEKIVAHMKAAGSRSLSFAPGHGSGRVSHHVFTGYSGCGAKQQMFVYPDTGRISMVSPVGCWSSCSRPGGAAEAIIETDGGATHHVHNAGASSYQ